MFDEGCSFLADNFGTHWDSPKAQYRKNYAFFLYAYAKQPAKGNTFESEILHCV